MPQIYHKKGYAMDYNAQDFEKKCYEIWEKRGYFEVDSNAKIANGKNFCIMMPPPNITGSLHIGHALTYTLQDIIVRFKRMQGFRTLWQPGIDHAGIATQNVVERQLLAKGIKKEQIGREAFLREVWAWKEKSGGDIISQLKRLGASAAWSRTRFTMDKGLQNAVKKAFVAWYDRGLIFQGDYMVNWCTHDGALSDIEVEFEENNGKLYYLRYFLKDSDKFVVVATTRPETYFGDTAVMVNPNDLRFAHLIGQKVVLPLIEREIEIIADEVVDMEFGTGAVKVTPAHDNNDYEVGLRHKLEFITIFDKNGILNSHCGEFAGLERLEAREAIVARLESGGFVEKIEDYTNQIGKCYRCGNVVEPYISKQWFVKKDIAKETIKRVNAGECKFYPNAWLNNFNAWMNDLRDWCISRQLWWGHRIPVFYCDKCGIKVASEKDSEVCAKCGSEMRQDEDVLDTWFSSGLWAFSTLGWGNSSCGNSSLDFGNSFSGNHSADSALDSAIRTKIAESAPTSSLRGSGEATTKQSTKNNHMDCHDSATQNLAMTENNTDSANAESNKNNQCEAPKSRPLRGAKNRIQGCSSATADFLLEAEKRGTPPKSEKRQLLARRGSGAGGAALLREKTSESNPKNGDFIADSAIQTTSLPDLSPQDNAHNALYTESDLTDFYPNSLLVTSFDILFFWVARMLFSGESLLGKLPFKDIYLHALVCDENGKKMSKSRGNVINPLVLIETHSSDILRFSLAYNCIQGRDIKIGENSLTIGNALVIKIINALNFLLLYKEQQTNQTCHFERSEKSQNRDSSAFSKPQNDNMKRDFATLDSIKSPLGLYIYAKFNICAKEVRDALTSYRFNDGANALYRFLFNDFCDFGIEAVKAQKEAVFEVGAILRETMKLLHPFMPFVSEFVWQSLRGSEIENADSIMIERFPECENSVSANLSVNSNFEVIRDIVTTIRRAKISIDLANKPISTAFIKANLNDTNLAEIFIKKLAKCDKIDFVKSKMPNCIFEIGESCEVYIPANAVDLGALTAKLEAKMLKTQKEITKLELVLNNANFIKNAPKNLVDSNQNALNEANSRLNKITEELQNLRNLGGNQ
ncbi:valine--tRNA ligase [Helicobacter sp. 23-1045]